jgi:biopolymer transport protein ExbD
MPIHKPDKILLHRIPLEFVKNSVAGGGRKSVDHEIPLIPFIDFLIVLVVFLLMSFAASGELVAQSPTIQMPTASNTDTLEIAPIVAVDSQVLTLDGNRVGDTQTLAGASDMERIEPLVQELERQKRNWAVLHPNDPFDGRVIIQADDDIDFRVIKKVMFSAAQAGYTNINFAVNAAGEASAEGGDEG